MKRQNTLLWNAMFLLIFLINTTINVGQQMINTLVPKYAEYLSGVASVVGLVSGMFSFSALLLRPFASPAFDSFGKKRLLQLSLLVMCLTMVLYSMANSVPMILVARAFHGMSYGCIGTLCLAIAGDTLPREKLGSGIGIFTLAQAIAQAIGPNIGLSLQKWIGYSGAFLAGLGIMGISLIMTLFLKEAPIEGKRPPYRLRPKNIITGEALKPSIILLFMSLAQAGIVAFLVIYGDKRGIGNVGLYFTAHAVCLFASRPLAGKLLDRFGFRKVIVPGILCAIAAFWVISYSTRVEHLILAGALAAFGFGTTQPSVQAISMKLVPASKRGAGANTNYIFIDLGAIGGSYLVGVMIDALLKVTAQPADAYAIAFRVMSIPMVVALIYTLLAFRDREQGGATAHEAD